jgi:hypothetical protein
MEAQGRFAISSGDLGPVFRGDERLGRGDWCAYYGQAATGPVTVAMFAHPGNPRPATWFTMREPFAYLSATLRLHEEPMRIEPGERVDLRYAVALWDGHAGEDTVAALYEEWAGRASGAHDEGATK